VKGVGERNEKGKYEIKVLFDRKWTFLIKK
jgi:hypothetical protein